MNKLCMPVMVLMAVLLMGCDEVEHNYTYSDPMVSKPDGTVKTVAPTFIMLGSGTVNVNEIANVIETRVCTSFFSSEPGCRIELRNRSVIYARGVTAAEVYAKIEEANRCEQ